MTPQELRDWRKAHGLTQDQAATWVGVSRRQWIRFEQGDVVVPKWLRIIVHVVPAFVTLDRCYGPIDVQHVEISIGHDRPKNSPRFAPTEEG